MHPALSSACRESRVGLFTRDDTIHVMRWLDRIIFVHHSFPKGILFIVVKDKEGVHDHRSGTDRTVSSIPGRLREHWREPDDLLGRSAVFYGVPFSFNFFPSSTALSPKARQKLCVNSVAGWLLTQASLCVQYPCRPDSSYSELTAMSAYCPSRFRIQPINFPKTCGPAVSTNRLRGSSRSLQCLCSRNSSLPVETAPCCRGKEPSRHKKGLGVFLQALR